MNIKSALLTATLLISTYNTTHTMAPFLLTLASDTSVVASICSLVVIKSPWAKKAELFLKSGLQPSQWLLIHTDAQAICSLIPILLPLGFVGSAGIRVNRIIHSPVTGTLKGALSIPTNLALICGAYALRVYLAPDNADTGTKLIDSGWNWFTKKW